MSQSSLVINTAGFTLLCLLAAAAIPGSAFANHATENQEPVDSESVSGDVGELLKKAKLEVNELQQSIVMRQVFRGNSNVLKSGISVTTGTQSPGFNDVDNDNAISFTEIRENTNPDVNIEVSNDTDPANSDRTQLSPQNNPVSGVSANVVFGGRISRITRCTCPFNFGRVLDVDGPKSKEVFLDPKTSRVYDNQPVQTGDNTVGNASGRNACLVPAKTGCKTHPKKRGTYPVILKIGTS